LCLINESNKKNDYLCYILRLNIKILKMSNIESTEMNDLLDKLLENIKIKFNSKIQEFENKIIDLKDKNKILENTNTDFIKIIGYYQNKHVEKQIKNWNPKIRFL